MKPGEILPKKLQSLLVRILSLSGKGSSLFYNDEFFKTHLQWLEEVKMITNVIYEEFKPKSVVDFGCGIGSYLYFFLRLGCEVQGYERSEKALNYALIERKMLTKHDLRKPLTLKRTYDLTLCFEVMEHISRKFENQVLETICSSSDLICLSAATPQQGGMDHVNERLHEYWIQEMKKRGFDFLINETQRMRTKLNGIKETVWIKKNLMAFRKPISQLS